MLNYHRGMEGLLFEFGEESVSLMELADEFVEDPFDRARDQASAPLGDKRAPLG